MTNAILLGLAPARRAGKTRGIVSICSAHPQVIGAALAYGRSVGGAVLIEATCNQVNQDGGYTGMTPAAFRGFVLDIAATEGFDPAHLILGGDHLGPNPWVHLTAEQAMDKAKDLVAAYVGAGFSKIHLDASMPCRGDPNPLPDEVIAARNASLAVVAEAQAVQFKPVYVIGTEVPIPGGALEAVNHLPVTTPQAAIATAEMHKAAFEARGISDAYDRIVGLVVQPGVEFGNENVVAYRRERAQPLVGSLDRLPMVFEAHSTDYQTQDALADLVRDGFSILKVGPGLTFALREALYSLDCLAEVLFPNQTPRLRDVLEALMMKNPKHWEKYCSGSLARQKFQRHFSYSDRLRYYWANPAAAAAVADLMALFERTKIPETLISQFFGQAYGDVMAGKLPPSAPALVRHAMTRVLKDYHAACSPDEARAFIATV